MFFNFIRPILFAFDLLGYKKTKKYKITYRGTHSQWRHQIFFFFVGGIEGTKREEGHVLSNFLYPKGLYCLIYIRILESLHWNHSSLDGCLLQFVLQY